MKRLKSRKAHAENPHSRTQRMIATCGSASGSVTCSRSARTSSCTGPGTRRRRTYVGRYEHLLEVTEPGLLIRRRRAVLVNEGMPPGARLSFIL